MNEFFFLVLPSPEKYTRELHRLMLFVLGRRERGEMFRSELFPASWSVSFRNDLDEMYITHTKVKFVVV